MGTPRALSTGAGGPPVQAVFPKKQWGPTEGMGLMTHRQPLLPPGSATSSDRGHTRAARPGVNGCKHQGRTRSSQDLPRVQVLVQCVPNRPQL